jgi:deoxycytidylate deaminase
MQGLDREDLPSQAEAYMATAYAQSHCSHCLKRNGPLTTARYKCGEKIKAILYPSRGIELCTAIHAEERAIRSLADRRAVGGTMYVTTFPCFQCARRIIDVGINKVVYLEAYPVKESLEFFQNNHITIEPFSGFTARSFSRVFRQLE